MTASTDFEGRLLEQLRQIVAERPAPAASPHRRPQRSRLVMAGAGVAAATAAVAVVATSSDVTPRAYAVAPRSDGSVTVQIHSLRDAAGLQSSLRAAGVPAVVDYVPDGGSGCAGPGPGHAPGPGAGSGPVQGVARGDSAGTGRGGSADTARGGSADTASGATSEGPSLQTGGGLRTQGEDGPGSAPSLSGPGPAPGAGAGKVTVSSRVRLDSDGATFTIDPGDLKDGQHVYITTSTGAVSSIAMAIGKVAPSAACADHG
jgi:hypothetical protein